MTRVKKVRMLLLALAVCIIAVMAGIGMIEKKKQIVIKSDSPRDASRSANVELKNVAYSNTNKDNFKEWDLNAQSAQYFQEGKIVVLEDAVVNLYRPDGKTYRVKGLRGEFNTETKNIKMFGAIEGTMPDNTTVFTESFFYDNEKRIITTDDKIIIKRSNFSMEGLGMIIDLNAEKLSILRNVKALGSK